MNSVLETKKIEWVGDDLNPPNLGPSSSYLLRTSLAFHWDDTAYFINDVLDTFILERITKLANASSKLIHRDHTEKLWADVREALVKIETRAGCLQRTRVQVNDVV